MRKISYPTERLVSNYNNNVLERSKKTEISVAHRKKGINDFDCSKLKSNKTNYITKICQHYFIKYCSRHRLYARL